MENKSKMSCTFPIVQSVVRMLQVYSLSTAILSMSTVRNTSECSIFFQQKNHAQSLFSTREMSALSCTQSLALSVVCTRPTSEEQGHAWEICAVKWWCKQIFVWRSQLPCSCDWCSWLLGIGKKWNSFHSNLQCTRTRILPWPCAHPWWQARARRKRNPVGLFVRDRWKRKHASSSKIHSLWNQHEDGASRRKWGFSGWEGGERSPICSSGFFGRGHATVATSLVQSSQVCVSVDEPTIFTMTQIYQCSRNVVCQLVLDRAIQLQGTRVLLTLPCSLSRQFLTAFFLKKKTFPIK